MMNKVFHKCLCCYKELDDKSQPYHAACATKLFGCKLAPSLPYTRDNIEELALQVLQSSTSVTGVQPKLSLDINRGGKNEPNKLTIVGLWGNFILKPQSQKYKSMPELEDVTMKLAELAGIPTAPHGLIYMNDGELAYITRRMDRANDGRKFSMLDMCQLTNRLTEHKYRGVYLQLAETIKKYSVTPMLDVSRFWEVVIFSWIVGNSDMHCKNFSLLHKDGIGYQLSPAYDLLAVHLTGISDYDELAMPLMGASQLDDRILAGFNRTSFIQAMVSSGLQTKVAERVITKLECMRDKWFACLEQSFLGDDLVTQYKQLIDERLGRLK